MAEGGIQRGTGENSYFSLRDLGTGQYNTFFFFSPLLPSGLTAATPQRRQIQGLPEDQDTLATSGAPSTLLEHEH
jgi:hypothetical protein